MNKVCFRQMHIDDYDRVVDLWKESGLKVETNGIDSFEVIRKSLSLMPQLHMVAEDKGEIVGVIIGSFDVRKGYLHRLAVKREYRGQGIAKKLISYIEAELIKLGSKRIDCLIFKNNPISKSLLKKMGYEPAYNVLYLTKTIDGQKREPKIKEKRRTSRIGIELKVKLKAAKYGFEDSMNSINISGGGVMVPIARKLPIGTQVDLEIFLPQESLPLKIKGKIVWIKSLPEKKEAGLVNSYTQGMSLFSDGLYSGIEFVEFDEISQNDEARLLDFIHSRLHKRR
jgi:N-acetylglutamate synthase-like GNAT family acetyltransferase